MGGTRMKTVLVGGVFNIIHPGHIYFLKKAKSFGKKLVVVLATDEKARQKTFFVPAKERRRVLESISFVDKVVVGDEENLFKIVLQEKPDIIVLGYDQDEEWLKKEIEKRGLKIKIKRLNRYGTYSTSFLHPKRFL
ncbi:MAG: FAD synthase [Candidatus Aenigmarchaeota archaeon ex4484_14]|nr:MAG: FAD synthase [Candidatus Aenigmarchaeota archaeon ex4484_14]